MPKIEFIDPCNGTKHVLEYFPDSKNYSIDNIPVTNRTSVFQEKPEDDNFYTFYDDRNQMTFCIPKEDFERLRQLLSRREI
jgi:hypothetical protein